MTPAVQCVYCQEEGHRARDCPKERVNPHACKNCKQEGHNAKECPEPRSAEGVECRKCNETGHFSKDVSLTRLWRSLLMLTSYSVPTLRLVHPEHAVTAALKITSRRSVISPVIQTTLPAATVRSKATSLAIALSQRIGQRCSVKTARNSVIPSRSVIKPPSMNPPTNDSQRCKTAPAEGNAMGSGGAVEATGGWGAGDDTAAAGAGEASWGNDTGGGGW